jgi:hypothetical protein
MFAGSCTCSVTVALATPCTTGAVKLRFALPLGPEPYTVPVTVRALVVVVTVTDTTPGDTAEAEIATSMKRGCMVVVVTTGAVVVVTGG